MYEALSVSSCPNEALYLQFQSSTTLRHERLGVFRWYNLTRSRAMILGEAPSPYSLTAAHLCSWLKLGGRGIIPKRPQAGWKTRTGLPGPRPEMSAIWRVAHLGRNRAVN